MRGRFWIGALIFSVQPAFAEGPHDRPVGRVDSAAEALCVEKMQDITPVLIEGEEAINSKEQVDGTISVWVDFTFKKSGGKDTYRCDVKEGSIVRHDLADTWLQPMEMPFGMPM